MPRRALGTSSFDIVTQEAAGAFQLWGMIHKEPAKFQAARSLYIQISADRSDHFDDDQWALALEAIRPGNVPHNLKVIKIEIVGEAWFEPYSRTVLSLSSSDGVRTRAQNTPLDQKPPPLHVSEGTLVFLAERAVIKALSNIRGVEKVEIMGPMQADLKKQLAVAMTTRAGRKVRDWRYGGGLRSDDEISWGTWSATMQPTDEEEEYAATAYELNPFPSQAFIPKQPMQILAYPHFEPNRAPSFTTVGLFGEIAKPKIPLDDRASPDGILKYAEPDDYDSDDSLASTIRIKRADSPSDENVHYQAQFPPSPSRDPAHVNSKTEYTDSCGTQAVSRRHTAGFKSRVLSTGEAARTESVMEAGGGYDGKDGKEQDEGFGRDQETDSIPSDDSADADYEE